MSTDVYVPCPCGSGKKLKFCCHAIVSEMSRIRKLQQNHQTKQAIQILEDLKKQHPQNPWIITTQAASLMEEGRSVEAKTILQGLLESNPDHLFAVALFAAVALSADGFEKAKPAIHRAFQRCPGVFPDVVSGVAMGIAALMFSLQNYMAARQHLAMAMRFAPEKDQQDIFVRLLDFDSNGDVPYPLRGVHALATYAPEDDEHLKEAEKAVRLSNLGCWALSARIFAKLAEKDPENASLWHNAGLCHAWDGNNAKAAEAFHKASELYDDYETAVESETLAQLIELSSSDNVLKVVSRQYTVTSVGKLLTLLDENDKLVRVQVPPDEEQSDTLQPAAIFNVLDRTIQEDDHTEQFTLETVPNVLAEISIFDHNPIDEQPARAFITGFEGEPLQKSSAIFEEAGQDQIELVQDKDEQEQALESLPCDLFPLHWRWHFPAKTSMKVRKTLELQQWDHLLEKTWPNTALNSLDGKTPLETAEDDTLKVRLAGAVMVLDAYADRNRYILDTDSLFKRLKLSPFSPIKPTADTPLNALSAIQMHRLSIADMSDEELTGTLNRALLIHHNDFLYRVLIEVLNRPACVEKVDCNRAYFTLAELCRDRFRLKDALEWIAKGQELAETGEKAFENVLQWKMRELTFRMEDPEDSELVPLLKNLWDYYGPKVPQLKTYLATVVNAYDIEPPWDSEPSIVTPDSAAATEESGGVWTPGTDAGAKPKEEGESKLWIPGQD